MSFLEKYAVVARYKFAKNNRAPMSNVARRDHLPAFSKANAMQFIRKSKAIVLHCSTKRFFIECVNSRLSKVTTLRNLGKNILGENPLAEPLMFIRSSLVECPRLYCATELRIFLRRHRDLA